MSIKPDGTVTLYSEESSNNWRSLVISIKSNFNLIDRELVDKKKGVDVVICPYVNFCNLLDLLDEAISNVSGGRWELACKQHKILKELGL